MSIFDIFSAAPKQQPPAQPNPPEPVQPGNIPQDMGKALPGNGVVPANTETESPLAPFENLWEPTPTDPNAPPSELVPPAPLKAEDVQAAVSKADFSKVITAEQLQAISEGGESAQQAFAQAMNAVAQQVMVQSTLVGNKLTEKAVEQALKAQESKIPGMLREQSTTSHLNDTNPLFQNPAVAPIIEVTKAQLLQKYPNSTP